MQFTEAQKAGITQMHITYVTNLAQIATRRQQLLQQLQDAPQPQGLHFEELAASHDQLDAVTQQLQMCALDENQLLLYQQTSLAVKVHISACVTGRIQILNLNVRPAWQPMYCAVQCFAPCVSTCVLTRLHQHCMSNGMTDSTTAACAAVAGLTQNIVLPAATCMMVAAMWCNLVLGVGGCVAERCSISALFPSMPRCGRPF